MKYGPKNKFVNKIQKQKKQWKILKKKSSIILPSLFKKCRLFLKAKKWISTTKRARKIFKHFHKYKKRAQLKLVIFYKTFNFKK